MYADHFKLSQRPFTHGPESGYFVPNSAVEAAIARLGQVMLARDSVAVVTGGPGVGKSALIAAAHATVADNAIVAHADLRQADPHMLFDMLLLALGAQPGDGNEAESMHRLKVLVREHNEEGQRVTAVIDVTGLTVERAKRLLQLTHLAGEPLGQLNVILLGPHALHRLLNAPGLIHLRQRVCNRYRVRPLTVDEIDGYLEEQFERADGDIASIMAQGAAKTVFGFVGGVPRLINTLMEAVLTEAALRQSPSISPGLIHEVAKALGWKQLVRDPLPASTAAAAPGTKPPELSLDQQARRPPAARTNPVSEATAMMLLDDNDASHGDTAGQPARNFPKASDKFGDLPSGMPAMSAEDTGATGMLRLEDLDARFAETVFGEDATKAVTDAMGATPPELPEEAAS
jgi:type II secretory pathway predicted ATPase ExeA